MTAVRTAGTCKVSMSRWVHTKENQCESFPSNHSFQYVLAHSKARPFVNVHYQKALIIEQVKIMLI